MNVECIRYTGQIMPGDVIYQGDNCFEYCQDLIGAKDQHYIYRPIKPNDIIEFAKEWAQGNKVPSCSIKRIG